MNRPKVSILCATYNHAAFLRETVESVFRQSYRPMELVVVDDASTDNSAEILRELQKKSPIPFKLEVSHKNRGLTGTANRALELAEGEFFSFLSSDDQIGPEATGKLVEAFERAGNDRLMIVYGNGEVIRNGRPSGKPLVTSETIELYRSPPQAMLENLRRGRIGYFSASLIRKSLFEAIGGWDESILADDGPTFLCAYRYLTEHNLEHDYIDASVYLYRKHDHNMHQDAPYMRKSINESMEKDYWEGEDREYAHHYQLIQLVRVCLEQGDIVEAIRTLNTMTEVLDEDQLRDLYVPRFMRVARECARAEKDPATDKWRAPALEEEIERLRTAVAKNKARAESQRSRALEFKEEIGRMKRSPAWRIARALTKPFRLFRTVT